jgi:NAD(P)-dependent dehydrogenase (short-subunit alcohol dehydrogenase family)
VTGASSGIGEACARRLAAAGFQLFAGVRKPQGGERLEREIAGVTAISIDVTDADSIAAAAERVGGSLAGLVNNAGIAVPAPLEYQPIEDFRRQIEVNVVGQVAVTQAFLPALRAARGRIVNVGSIGGRINTPFVGPYSSSKAAVRSLSASLRRELRPWGIQVALVEPGALDTPIWRKGEEGAQETIAALPERVRTLYARPLEALVAATRSIAAGAASPDDAAQAIEHALTAERPRTLYTVGRQARVQGALHDVLPARAFDALVARAMKT